MSGQLGDLVVSFSADMAKFTSDMGKAVKLADESSKKMVGSFELVTKSIGKLGAALIGGSMVAGFAKMIDSAAEWNIQAQKMANTFGITTEAASVFEVAIAKLGISHDTAVNAALKLSRTLSQGTDKFDQYGISVTDTNGKLLPMPQIMANVNEKLMQTKSGADRNVMALALYGRSWGELQGILRLTPEAMQKAQETADRLHLIVGPEGVAKAYAYKESIHELELVGHSLAIQLGSELMPAITSVAANMSGSGIASGFGKAIKEVVRDIQEAVVYWASFADKVGAWFSTGGILGHLTDKGAKDYAQKLAAINEAEMKSMQEIAAAYDRPAKKSTAVAGATIEVGEKHSGAGERNAYLAYLKSYYETIAQLQKQANDAEEQANQITWNWGLTSLQAYLDKKHSLNENSLQVELDAKKKELDAAIKAEAEAEIAYKKSSPAASEAAAEAVNKSYAITQKAVMAVNAAEAALQKARVANVDETKKELYDHSKGLNDLQAQVLELAALYGEAAKKRIEFERISPAFKQLSPAEQAEKEKLLGYQERQGMTKQEFAAQDTKNSMFGTTMFDSTVKQYEIMYRRIREIEDQFGKDSVQAANARMGAQVDTIRNGVNMISSQLMSGNKDQFEVGKALAIAMATVDSAMAVTKALSSATPPTNYVNAAMVAAATAVQIAKISSQQYQGRADGGPVNAGQTYWVGEKGQPELFTPGASGMITPMDKMGGANVTQHITIDARGADQGVEQKIKAGMKQAEENTKAAIFSSMQRGGQFAYASGRMK
jgi:hypothetical protein